MGTGTKSTEKVITVDWEAVPGGVMKVTCPNCHAVHTMPADRVWSGRTCAPCSTAGRGQEAVNVFLQPRGTK